MPKKCNRQPDSGCRPALEILLTPGPPYLDREASARGALAADADLVTNVGRLDHWDLAADAHGRVTFLALIRGATYRIAREGFKVEAGKVVKLADMDVSKPTDGGFAMTGRRAKSRQQAWHPQIFRRKL